MLIEDARQKARLEIALDDVVEHGVEQLQAPGLSPARHRGHRDRERERDGHRHAIKLQRMAPRGAEREQLVVRRQPPEAELHAEHEGERDGDDEEMRRQCGGDARQVGERDRAAEDDLVQLQELQHHQKLENGEQPHPERHEDLPQDQSIEERHPRPL